MPTAWSGIDGTILTACVSFTLWGTYLTDPTIEPRKTNGRIEVAIKLMDDCMVPTTVRNAYRSPRRHDGPRRRHKRMLSFVAVVNYLRHPTVARQTVNGSRRAYYDSAYACRRSVQRASTRSTSNLSIGCSRPILLPPRRSPTIRQAGVRIVTVQIWGKDFYLARRHLGSGAWALGKGLSLRACQVSNRLL